MKALFIGFGNVGQRMAEMLFLKEQNLPQFDFPELKITGIITQSRGALLDPDGIDMKEALLEIQKNGHFKNHKNYTEQLTEQALREWPYDVLVELTTLSISDKGEPATNHIIRAIKSGKHVVTANKGPVAFNYDKIKSLADKMGVHFYGEATVMDSAPVFSLSESVLKGGTITRISGILNSTTNFILTRMESGESFQKALLAAQENGFAEADPRHDLDGWDAAAKIAALSNVFMNARTSPLEVHRKGISDITEKEVAFQLKKNFRIKLVCKSWFESGQFHAQVAPEMIPMTHPFASISGTSACVKFESKHFAPVLITHETPTLNDTAHGVIQDLAKLFP